MMEMRELIRYYSLAVAIRSYYFNKASSIV